MEYFYFKGQGWNVSKCISLKLYQIKKNIFFKDIFDYRETELVKVGTNNYFGKEINVLPITTITKGLCYKLELSKGAIGMGRENLKIEMSSLVRGIDKLQGFSLMIASRNTWQGVVYGEKYKKAISIVTGNLFSGLIAFVKIELEESIWNYNNGEGNFDICMQENKKNNCKSIFDTSTFQDNTRYTNKYYKIKIFLQSTF